MLDKSKLLSLVGQMPGLHSSREEWPSLKIGDHWLHSRFAPWSEAVRLVEPVLQYEAAHTLVIVLGVGLGYHLHLLEEQGFRHFILLERYSAAWDIFQKTYQLGSDMLWICPADPPEKMDAVFNQINLEDFRHIRTIQLRGAYDPDLFALYQSRIQRILQVKMGDFTTRFYFEELWFIHVLKNLARAGKDWLVTDFRGFPAPVPVVIISAGPSLASSLQVLREIRHKAVLIAVDTALLPLSDAGIVPDLVFSLDSQVHNLSDFSFIKKEYLEQLILVADLVVNPALASHSFSRRVWSNTAHHDLDLQGKPVSLLHPLIEILMKKTGIQFGEIETGGSVATSAFHLAYLLGADPLILTGQDLAFSWQISHCPGTSHYYRILQLTSRVQTIESVFQKVIHKRNTRRVEGIQGEVLSDNSLNNYRQWFEESARNLKRGTAVRLYNATVQGARIEGFENLSQEELQAFFERLPQIDKSTLKPEASAVSPVQLNSLARELDDMRQYLLSLTVSSDIFEKIENSEYPYLSRYFLKEKMMWNRYEQWDELLIRRKIRRLSRALQGVLHA